jgi:hypothetical protein
MDDDSTTTTTHYVEECLPPYVIEKINSGAFQSLCEHLQQRSDEVQNIDLMTVSGFCRNCLAKVSFTCMLLLCGAVEISPNCSYIAF